MNQEQYERVRNACENQRAKGTTVKQQIWGVRNNGLLGDGWHTTGTFPTPCACALGCLLLEEQPTIAAAIYDMEAAAAAALDTSMTNVGRFISGFDEPWEHDGDSDEWAAAGARLAAELDLIIEEEEAFDDEEDYPDSDAEPVDQVA